MQFTLPTSLPNLLPVAPSSGEAGLALLNASGDGAAPSTFAVVLAEEVATPTNLGPGLPQPTATDRNPGGTGRGEPQFPKLVESTNILTTPIVNLLAAARFPLGPLVTSVAEELGAGQMPTAPDGTGQQIGSRQLLPRPPSRAAAGPTRREEEQAAVFALQSAVANFNVGLHGEISTVPSEGIAAEEGATSGMSASANLPDGSEPDGRFPGQPALWAGMPGPNNTQAGITRAGVRAPIELNDDVNDRGVETPPAAQLAAAKGPLRSEPTPPSAPSSPLSDETSATGGYPKILSQAGRLGAEAAPLPSPDTLRPRRELGPETQPAAPRVSEPGSAVDVAMSGTASAAVVGASNMLASTTPSLGRPGLRVTVEKNSTAARRDSGVAEMGPDTVGRKKILSAESQEDSESFAGLGIGVAKSTTKMRHDSQPPFAAFQKVEEIAVASSALTGLRDAMASLSTAATPPPVPVAAPRMQAVVNHVVETAHRLETQTVSSMAMRFNFGADEKLSVQVELRDGTVHTTFRTDSPMLRESLGTAWREMAPPNTIADGRTVRLADPSIGRETSTELSTQTGDGDRRSHQHTRDAEFTEASFALAAGRSKVVPRPPALVDPASAQPSQRLETVRHLHAIA